MIPERYTSEFDHLEVALSGTKSSEKQREPLQNLKRLERLVSIKQVENDNNNPQEHWGDFAKKIEGLLKNYEPEEKTKESNWETLEEYYQVIAKRTPRIIAKDFFNSLENDAYSIRGLLFTISGFYSEVETWIENFDNIKGQYTNKVADSLKDFALWVKEIMDTDRASGKWNNCHFYYDIPQIFTSEWYKKFAVIIEKHNLEIALICNNIYIMNVIKNITSAIIRYSKKLSDQDCPKKDAIQDEKLLLQYELQSIKHYSHLFVDSNSDIADIINNFFMKYSAAKKSEEQKHLNTIQKETQGDIEEKIKAIEVDLTSKLSGHTAEPRVGVMDRLMGFVNKLIELASLQTPAIETKPSGEKVYTIEEIDKYIDAHPKLDPGPMNALKAFRMRIEEGPSIPRSWVYDDLKTARQIVETGLARKIYAKIKEKESLQPDRTVRDWIESAMNLLNSPA